MFKKTNKAFVMIFLISCLLLLPLNIANCKKTLTTTDLTTFGGVESAASDINNLGQIIGVWYEAPPPIGLTPVHAFVLTNGVKTDLASLPNQITSEAVSINDLGQIAGFCNTQNPLYDPEGPLPRAPAYLPHAVMWTPENTIIQLETLPGVEASQTRDININGEIVGYIGEVWYIQIADPPAPKTAFLVPVNAFLWTPTLGMIELDIPLEDEETGSIATAINDQGTIVGYTLKHNENGAPTTSRAFVLNKNGDVTFINPPSGATITVATDINNKGQVIGFYATEPGIDQTGFVWTAKTGITQILQLSSAPSDSQIIPLEINSKGQVAGICTKRGDLGYPPAFERGFLWDDKKGITELPPLTGDQTSTARGLNNQGQVVGTSVTYQLLYRPDDTYAGYNAILTAIRWNT